MQTVIETYNRVSIDDNFHIPIEKYSGINDDIDPTHFHTWAILRKQTKAQYELPSMNLNPE